MITKDVLENRITAYEHAVQRLQNGLNSDVKDSIVIDGVIQRFEYSFELAWNLMKEFLEFSGIAGIRCPRGAIKEGEKFGLVEDSEAWLDMMTARNQTSYIYDEQQASEAYQKIQNDYLTLLEKLLQEIKKH